MAKPVAIATPRSPSHSPANAMSTQSTLVRVGHGDTAASTGAKKKPVPTYHDEPARSEIMTSRSHCGTGGLKSASLRMLPDWCPLVGIAITFQVVASKESRMKNTFV